MAQLILTPQLVDASIREDFEAAWRVNGFAYTTPAIPGDFPLRSANAQPRRWVTVRRNGNPAWKKWGRK